MAELQAVRVPALSSQSMSALNELMTEASAEMMSSLAKARKAMNHNLSKGEALEETVRVFLRGHLPGSIGITTGQVIDHHGNHSKQHDVILYDSNRTPMLFTSDEGGRQLVPSEGVIAVIEVKARLSTSNVHQVVENMTTVKSLDKSCYYLPPSPIEHSVNLYGSSFPTAPTMYFGFAFEGESPIHSIAQKLTELHGTRSAVERVDNICVLDSGVLLNGTPDGKADALPRPDTELVGYRTENALLMFYIFLTRYALQIQHPAINIQKYLPDTFAF